MSDSRSSSSEEDEIHVAHYVDEIVYAACYANEFELNFHGAFLTDDEESISIANEFYVEINADNIMLEAEGSNFRPPPKMKKMNFPQVDFNKSHRPKERHCIRGLHKDPRNTWISRKHK